MRTLPGSMARRRRNREVDIAQGVFQLVALLFFAGMFFPQVRQMVLGLGVILIGAIILVVVLAFGVFLVRRTQSSPPFSTPARMPFNENPSPAENFKLTVASVATEPARSITTANLIE